jgi:hypothetical protein
MAKKSEKESIYQKEKGFSQQAHDFAASDDAKEIDKLTSQFKVMTENYDELLDQVVLITRISDRLQKKLDQSNEELSNLNNQLNDKNVELQKTIDDLIKARAGRKATTIVFIFALILFVFSETLLEPYIDAFANNAYISLVIKGVIAMSIKPLEMLVEKGLLKSARKQKLVEIEQKANN